MPRRIAARLLTGPLAFLLAGLIDLGSFAIASARARRRGPPAGLSSGPAARSHGAPTNIRSDEEGQ